MRIWIEHCGGDPRDVYPRTFRVLTLWRTPEFPKRFTDDEILEHLSWRCCSPVDASVLDDEGFWFGKVWYAPESARP